MNKRQKKKKNPVKYRILRNQKRFARAMKSTALSFNECTKVFQRLIIACKDVPYIE